MMTLQDIVIGSEIHEYDCLASTNDKAKELAHSGCANGTVIVACQQTAGRGQGQHTWYSRSDAGMYFSVVIRPQRSDIEIQYYSLMTGVALITFETGNYLDSEARPQALEKDETH